MRLSTVAEQSQMDNTLDLQPGRFSITCIDAKNIRERADNAKENLAPYLLFRLNGTERTSKTGSPLGHNVMFNDEIISFDLPHPEDVELVIELRDNASNEAVGTATYPISKVLTLQSSSSTVETTEALKIIKPGDTTTNSVVNLKFAFVRAKTGVIKLNPSIHGADRSKDTYVMITTPDGQSKKASLVDADNALGFWINPSNWFGDFTVQLYKGSAKHGEGKLGFLSCLDGTEIRNVSSHVSMSKAEGDSQAQASAITISHWFLEAGFAQVHSITATSLRDASFDSSGVSNPRVIIKSHGKTHSTMKMTDAVVNADSNTFSWNDVIIVPIVDEYTLTIECCEYDEVAGDQEPIGTAEVSLLPLFKTGSLKASLDLKHVTELGETLEGGQVHFSLTFEAPKGAAFPRDQPTMTSYILGQSDTLQKTKKNMDMDVNDETFTEEAIQKAFTTFDLDKNGYIGVSELKHILIMMGEHVSDEEVDMMISMLDLNGDGQVSFKEFKAMVESDDPANEDFLQGGITAKTNESVALKKRNEQAKQKREVFSRVVSISKMDKDDVYRILKTIRDKTRDSNDNIRVFADYDAFCRDLMPTAFFSPGDRQLIFDLLKNDDQVVDSRDLIMHFTNFVHGFGLEERCELAFTLYDVDRSGYLSLDEIEAMMMSTNLTTRGLIKKRAENFMLCADLDRSGGITIDELIVAAEKLPNLLYPPQTNGSN